MQNHFETLKTGQMSVKTMHTKHMKIVKRAEKSKQNWSKTANATLQKLSGVAPVRLSVVYPHN